MRSRYPILSALVFGWMGCAQPAPPPVDREFLITVGLTDRASRLWEGAITVSGGELTGVEGWRFSQNDVARSNGKFEFRTKIAEPEKRLIPEGLVVRIRGGEDAQVQFRARTAAFTFSMANLVGRTKLSVLDGNGSVERLETER